MTEPGANLEPHVLADQLCAAMGRVRELLQAETAAIEEGRSDVLPRLQDEKRGAVQSYRALMHQLAAQPEARNAWSSAHRDGLRQGLGEMRETIRTNARALQANIEAGRQLMSAVNQAAQSQAADAFRYDDDARPGSYAPRQRAASILFNQVA
jgi:hypothetical protein